MKQKKKELNIPLSCRILEISVSGYYKYRKLILSNITKEEREQKDKNKIEQIVKKYKRKYGYRMITMKLQAQGITMNHKKVLRLMKKYNLLAKLRRRNPYKQIQKATQEHATKKNVLDRNF